LLARNLHTRGFTVAGPLLAGHGTNPQELSQTRWQDWVASAEETYQQLAAKCERVFIGGESMGGVLALYMATQHPEAVGVLTYAPAIKLALSRVRITALRLAMPFLFGVPKEQIDVPDKWQGYPINPLKSGVELLHMQREVRRRLPQIHQPVLVVQGRHDTTIAANSGAIIMHGVSSSIKELHWFEESSHVVILDKELDHVTELTVRFMVRALGL